MTQEIPIAGLGVILAISIIHILLSPLWRENIIASLILLTSFLSLKVIFSTLLKKTAMGSGDVAMAAILGLWLIPHQLPVFMIAAGSFGIACAILFRQERVPFIPAIVFGFYFSKFLTS